MQTIIENEPESSFAIPMDEIPDYMTDITKDVYNRLGEFSEKKQEYEDRKAIFLAAYKIISNENIYIGKCWNKINSLYRIMKE